MSSNGFAFDNFIQWIHSTTTASAETTTENAVKSKQNEVKTVSKKQLAATQQTNNWKRKPNDRRTDEEKESKHKINNKT